MVYSSDKGLDHVPSRLIARRLSPHRPRLLPDNHRLEGDIKDSSGAIVPGVKIQVINTDTGVVTHFVTGSDGRFLALSLTPGPYSVVAEAAGFKKTDRSGIVLQVNQSARIDLVMEVGSHRTPKPLEIKGEAPLLESSSAALGPVIENKSITKLPLNQRNL